MAQVTHTLLTENLIKLKKILSHLLYIFCCCCCSVAQSCPTLFDSMNRSMPGFPVLKYSLELAQTHVHRVSDAIQPSHPLSSPSLPAFNLAQHESLFQCKFFPSGGPSIGASTSASVLPMNIQD